MNDFIQGMKILLGCKKYAERRLRYLCQLSKTLEENGKDASSTNREIAELKTILGGAYDEF